LGRKTVFSGKKWLFSAKFADFPEGPFLTMRENYCDFAHIRGLG
jgi:hypothetical protein